MNIAAQGFYNEQAKQNNEEAANLNFQLGEMAADAANERWRENYDNYLSPAAKIKQLKTAGMSPSLAYSMLANGAGGSTAPQGGGAGGQQGKSAMGMAITSGNELTLAEARKANAEADILESEGKANKQADTGLKKAQSILTQSQKNLMEATAGMQKAHELLMNAQTNWQNIENSIKQSTQETVVQTIDQSLRNLQQEWVEMNSRINLNQANRQAIEKVSDEQARMYHAQVMVMFNEAYEKLRRNQQFDETYNDAVKIIEETARKAAAAADNEEDYIRRFNDEMKQRRRDNWFQLGGDVLNAASNIATSAYSGHVGKQIAKTMQKVKYVYPNENKINPKNDPWLKDFLKD